MSNHLADLSSYTDQNTNHNINENELNKSMMLQKRMLSKSEDVSTDLTIKTSEGDIVKLSTKSFYDFKSLLYDKKGQVYSHAGTITNRASYRAMTLKSGERFYEVCYRSTKVAKQQSFADKSKVKGKSELLSIKMIVSVLDEEKNTWKFREKIVQVKSAKEIQSMKF